MQKNHVIHEEWTELLNKAKELGKLTDELQIKEMSANVKLVTSLVEQNADHDKIPALLKIISEHYNLLEPMFEAELADLNKPVV